MLSEAGPTIASTLVSSGLADRLLLLTAPIAGGGGPSAFNGLDRVIDLKALRVRKLGDDVAMEAEL